MDRQTPKHSRFVSPPHPPLVEVKVVEAPHAWPNWQSFSPAEQSALSSTYKSRNDADTTAQLSPSEAGSALQTADDGTLPDSERGTPQRRSGPQVSTVALLALVMCFGVCLVGVFGFLPIYLIGFRDVSAAVQVSQTQAVASMVAAASMSVRRLPNIIKFILAAYMSSYEGSELCFMPDAERTRFYLANVLDQDRYRHFMTLLSGGYDDGQRQLFVSVSPALKGAPIAATGPRSPGAVHLYAVDPATHQLAPQPSPIWNSEVTAAEYIRNRQDACRAYCSTNTTPPHSLFIDVKPNAIAPSSKPVELWLPWNVSGSMSYFNVIIPLSPALGDGLCSAFFEGGLRSSYVADVVKEHFRYAVRRHGCYMIVDVARDLVVVNSWNQSILDPPEIVLSYKPFPLSTITNPLMRAALADLERRGGLRHLSAGLDSSATSAVTFFFKGERAVLRVSPIRDPHGLDLMFLSVTTQRDFFGSIDSTLRALTGAMLAAVVVTAIVSYAAAVYMRRAIRRLTEALRASSKLQFTREPGTGGSPISHIAELTEVERAYSRVQQQLMTLKTVLPCPLLVMEEEEEELTSDLDASDDGDGNGERNLGGGSSSRPRVCSLGQRLSWESLESMRLRLQGAPLEKDGGGSDSGSGDGNADTDAGALGSDLGFSGKELGQSFAARLSRRWQRNVVLNTKVFNEKVNVFRKRYCTIVWISRFYTTDMSDDSVDTFTKIVYAATLEFKGCLQFLRPDYAVVTFNAHTSLPMHAKRGCEMAMAVQRRLSAEAVKLQTTLVDTNNFFVGICGSEKGMRVSVVVDVMHLFGISQLQREKGYHQVVVTQSTAKHLQYHETVPLEVVSIPFYQALFTLYELREMGSSSGNTVAEMQRTAEWFRSGFQLMRIGDYVNALKAFTHIAPSDVTAQRLKLECMRSIRAGSKRHYLWRVRYPKLRILSRVIHLRNTANLHLFATRLWKQGHVDGFFAPGPFTATVRSAEGSGGAAREQGESDADGEGDGRQPRRGNAADGGAAKASPLLGASALDAAERASRLWAGDAGDDSSGSGLASSSGRDGALIEWINFHSASDTEDGEELTGRDAESAATAVDVVPLCLLDNNGYRWNRALKADHSGPSSVVYQAMADDGLQVAIKFLPKKNRSIPEARLYNEIDVMSKLKHLNIVQYISYVWTAAHIGIVMEYAPGGSLRDIIDGFGALPESLVRRYMVDVLHGLAYLHRGGITHGDVKPHNILLGVDGVCKLSDFGSTVCEATDLARSNGMLEFRGTAVYTSPEVASGQLPTAASDIYSLGISFLQMLMGRLPWHWADGRMQARHGDCTKVREVAFVQAVGRGEIRPVVSAELSMAAQEFARACCHTDPAERPTVAELLSFRFVL